MDPEKQTTESAGNRTGTADSWREVGQQFQALGASLAEALRAAWQSEENRRHLQQMQSGLEAMVNEIGSALQDSTHSPQAQQARSEAARTADTMRQAGEQTFQEIRPQLINALHAVNEELRKLTNRMESANKSEAKPQEPPAAER